MHGSPHNSLTQEWAILHKDHERYDRYGLLIKLVATLACLLSLGLKINLWLALVFILVLWLQEGIWRTVQARTCKRLLSVEMMIKESDNQSAMQLYSNWEASRPGMAGLIKEYLLNAIRPTVAYPYIILLGVDLAVALFNT